MTQHQVAARPLHWVVAGFVAVCVASLGGALTNIGDWYFDLAKPSWQPPDWLFGPAWTLLYTMMAVAAWLVWRRGGWSAQKRPLGLFLLQWFLNALWTPLFFGLHQTGLALAEILALWTVLAMTLAAFWRRTRRR